MNGAEVKAIFINKKHPSFVRCTKDVLIGHLIGLVTNELVAMSFERSEYVTEPQTGFVGLYWVTDKSLIYTDIG